MALHVCVALIFAAPFIINLESPSIALGVVTNETTGLKNLLLIWLIPVLPVLILLSITQLSVNYRVLRFVIATAVSVTTFFILIQMITGNSNALIDRGSGWLSLMVIVIFIGIALQQALYHDNQNNKALGLSLLLVALAFSIIFLTEFFNIVTGTPGRFNTVFKIWYHVWTLLAVASSISIGIIVNKLPKSINYSNYIFASKNIKYFLPICSICFLIYGLSYIYSPMMALSRAHENQEANLNSVVYLKNSDPGLYGAISYAKEK